MRCAYIAAKEFPNKLVFVDYRWKGCHVGPLVLGYKVKGEGLPLYPNLKTTALSLVIAEHVESGIPLPIRDQNNVGNDQDLSKYPKHNDVVTK